MGTEHTPPPGRWNDEAIDRLAGNVDDHGNELIVLRGALERVVRMETHIAALLEAHRDERDTSRKFRAETRQRFDDIDKAHESSPSKAWLTVLVSVIGLVGVIVSALISAYVIVKTGSPKP